MDRRRMGGVHMAAGNDLASFLRACRERTAPHEVGLPLGRRRTPGLRREEVASLAGISMDYYVRLEQGRERNPSQSVLTALAGVFLLDLVGAEHLANLARHAGDAERSGVSRLAPTASRETIGTLLGSVLPLPAYVLDAANDIVEANATGLALLHGITDWPRQRRNSIRYLFLHPTAPVLFPQWSEVAQDSVAQLRASFGRTPSSVPIHRLVDELSEHSTSFRELWSRADVGRRTVGRKRFDHPVVGAMCLTYDVLEVCGSDGHRMVVYQAAPGSVDHEAIVRLARTVLAEDDRPALAQS